MNFWDSKMGEFIYELNYENLVKDKEKEIRNLIDFCGLEFDNACLNHHNKSKTPIKTVSVTQARSPIYSSSVNKNEFYKKNLNQLFSLLD